MQTIPLNNVHLHATADTVGTFRVATAISNIQEFTEQFGQPHQQGDNDKVTAVWGFRTPRGPAAIRDYWWNGKRELSIAARNFKAGLWMAAWCRANGIQARREI